jgi:Uncharacterized protein conserved in bacteria (DUF2125)
MRRKRLIALAVLPAMLLAGDFVYWQITVRHLRSGFESWAAIARASGWDIRHGPVIATGWPDAAGLRIENLTVTASDVLRRNGMDMGGVRLDRITWGSDVVLLRAGLTQPGKLEITPIGLHPLRLNDGAPIPIAADHLRLRLILPRKPSTSTIDIDAVTLTAAIPGFGPLSAGQLNAHVDLKPGIERDQAAIAFSGSVQALILPASVHWGLAHEVGEIELEGVLNGPLPPANGPRLAGRVTSWRDEGGSLELHRLMVDWGDVKLDATATLALDDELQPMGAGTGKITGYGVALNALAADGVLTRSAATAAKAVLALLATTPAEGQPEEVEVPLTLQFRTLSVRQVPLLRLPELDWTGP